MDSEPVSRTEVNEKSWSLSARTEVKEKSGP
jgi:hypothetical protein